MYFQQYGGLPQQGTAGYGAQGAAFQQQLQQQQQQQAQAAFNSFQQPTAQAFTQQTQPYQQSAFPQAYAQSFTQQQQPQQQQQATNFTSLATPFSQQTQATAYPQYYNTATTTSTATNTIPTTALTSQASIAANRINAYNTPPKPTPLPTPAIQSTPPLQPLAQSFPPFKPLIQPNQVLQAQQMLALKAQQAQQQLQQQQLQIQQQQLFAQRQALAAQTSRTSGQQVLLQLRLHSLITLHRQLHASKHRNEITSIRREMQIGDLPSPSLLDQEERGGVTPVLLPKKSLRT
jgi:hypothetical protein